MANYLQPFLIKPNLYMKHLSIITLIITLFSYVNVTGQSCVPPANVDPAMMTSNSAVLTWDQIYDIETYIIRVAQANTRKFKEYTTRTNSLTLESGTLEPCQTYIFAVAVQCIDGTVTEFSGRSTFKTPGCETCDAPEQIYTVEDNGVITLSWDRVDDAQGYVLQGMILNSNNPRWISKTLKNNSITLARLKDGTEAKWRVAAICKDLYSAPSNEGFFIVDRSRSAVTNKLNASTSTTAAEINIYPNPASDLLNIRIPEVESEDAEVHLYNAEGKELVRKVITDSGLHSFSIEHLPRGVYYLRINQGTQLITRQVMIAK